MNDYRILRLYNTMLRLLPPRFREEFGQEMAETFAQRLAEANRHGRNLLLLWLDELVALPGVLLQAYATPHAWSRSDEALEPGPLAQPWRELLLSLVVFLLPAGMLLFGMSDLNYSSTPGFMEVLLFLGIMLSLGWIGGFPLWSRPYIGLILAVSAYLYVFQLIASQISPALISNFTAGTWDRSSYLVLRVASNGMLWLMLFCLTLLAVALLAVFNRFQPLLEQLRYDWSMLSYILYGESVFALMMLQSQKSEPGYMLASLLCLVAGVWFFLWASPSTGAASGQRLLVLLACLTLAVSVSALQTVGEQSGGGEKLLLIWGSMAAAVLLPGLLARLFTTRPAGSAASS
jgi:hypothetical protein